MPNIRCECGKILCQSDHEFIVIKCRHCKRYKFIKKEDFPQVMPNSHFADKSKYTNCNYTKHA